MPRTCVICVHPEREAIDAALVAGESFRNVAERFGTSATGAFRHKGDHLPATLAKAAEAAEVAHADTLLGQLAGLRADARRIGGTAESLGDLKTALSGVRELVRIVELTAKLVGEIDDRPQVNVTISPQWIEIRAVLLDALGAYPDARTAVAASLLRLEGTQRAG